MVICCWHILMLPLICPNSWSSNCWLIWLTCDVSLSVANDLADSVSSLVSSMPQWRSVANSLCLAWCRRPDVPVSFPRPVYNVIVLTSKRYLAIVSRAFLFDHITPRFVDPIGLEISLTEQTPSLSSCNFTSSTLFHQTK